MSTNLLPEQTPEWNEERSEALKHAAYTAYWDGAEDEAERLTKLSEYHATVAHALKFDLPLPVEYVAKWMIPERLTYRHGRSYR